MVYFIVVNLIILIFSFTRAQMCDIDSNSLQQALFSHQSAYDSKSNSLYFFGGMTRWKSSTYSNSIYKWNMTQFTQNTWTELSVTTPSSEFRTACNNAVTVNAYDAAPYIYFIGMWDGSYTSGNVYVFNLSNEQWLNNTNIAPLPYPSAYGCVTQNKTHIFMVGGRTINTFIDKLQIYNINDNIWKTETINISSIINTGWSQGFCHSISTNLYVFGGFFWGSYTSNIFKYDPINKWVSLGLESGIKAQGVTAYHEACGIIFIIGGWDADKIYHDTIYVFDVNTESISDVWTMSEKKSSPSAQVIYDNLYIFGGITTNDAALATIEICSIPDATFTTTASNDITTTAHKTTAQSTDIATTISNISELDTTLSFDAITSSNVLTSEIITTNLTTLQMTTKTTDDREKATPQASDPIASKHSYNITTSQVSTTMISITDASISQQFSNTSNEQSDSDHYSYDADWLLYGGISIFVLILILCCGCVFVYLRDQKKSEQRDAAIIEVEMNDVIPNNEEDEVIEVDMNDNDEGVTVYNPHTKQSKYELYTTGKRRGEDMAQNVDINEAGMKIGEQNDHDVNHNEGGNLDKNENTDIDMIATDEFEVVAYDETTKYIATNSAA